MPLGYSLLGRIENFSVLPRISIVNAIWYHYKVMIPLLWLHELLLVVGMAIFFIHVYGAFYNVPATWSHQIITSFFFNQLCHFAKEQFFSKQIFPFNLLLGGEPMIA